MNKTLTLLFAIACGSAVGNLYWAQPLLDVIAHDLHILPAQAAWLITATQIGYALGVFCLVPLGDVLQRKKLIPYVMFSCVASALFCATATDFTQLTLGLVALGITSVTGQLLIPLAGDLVDEKSRGKVIGTIVAGVLIGILSSRTISGIVAQWLGWRAIYWMAAIFNAILATILVYQIPALPTSTHTRYILLLKSIFSLIKHYPIVRVLLSINALIFSIFTLYWTSLTFLLSSAPYQYSVSQIGLLGLAGLAGALGAKNSGKLFDRGLYTHSLFFAMVGVGISLLLNTLMSHQIIIVITCIVVLDLAIQSIGVLNQTRLLTVDHSARSRLNSAFVCCNFIGGAIGSSFASVLWHYSGWTLTMTAALIILMIAILIFVTKKKYLI